MNKLYFKRDKEVICFCEAMFERQQEINLQWKKDRNFGNEIILNIEKIRLEDVIACLSTVFLQIRVHELIRKIVVEDYFFTNDLEIEEICELTNWVVCAPDYGNVLFKEQGNVRRYIATLLSKKLIDDQEVYFDSLVTFCLKPLMKHLMEAVAYAIDEQKREEEYQHFVQSVRVYIGRSRFKNDDLHIVQGEYFTYYNEVGKRYSLMELRGLMEREPLYMIGLDEDEMNLAPILTLAPRRIFLYGNNPDDAKTLSLLNLYQERIVFSPREAFPFDFELYTE